MSGGVTAELASFSREFQPRGVPGLRSEGVRALLNWVGCALGGWVEPAVAAVLASLPSAGDGRCATAIGHGAKLSLSDAALVNCLSSSVLAYDDTHLPTIAHPTGPVAAALLAFCETTPVTGEELIDALIIGMEVECRCSLVLAASGATNATGFYTTGLAGPIGAAAAVGRLLGLDDLRMTAAIGLAAAQASGFRATHGSMAGALIPAFAARSGLSAALMAAHRVTCSADSLEGRNGFFAVFAPGADPMIAVERLGDRFEMLRNAYKPYPCGIVIHPAVDAALELAARGGDGASPSRIVVRLHPLALALADRPEPKDAFEAQVSIQHWVAAALVRGRAGIAEARSAALADPAVIVVRRLVSAEADDRMGRAEAFVRVSYDDGSELHQHVAYARGSAERPMDDAELDAKFLDQAGVWMRDERAKAALLACRTILDARDAGATLMGVLNEGCNVEGRGKQLICR